MSIIEEIAAERKRQIEVEGWTPEHDDEHSGGEMMRAAMIYLHWGTEYAPSLSEQGVPLGWPWDAKWWKPKDRRSNLIRAGALMLAEKERLGRVRWREFAGYKALSSQPQPVRVYIPRLGMPTDHVDHKLDICRRELAALRHDPPPPAPQGEMNERIE